MTSSSTLLSPRGLLAGSTASIAQAVRSQQISSYALIHSLLEHIPSHDTSLNCVTRLLHTRALAQARTIDETIKNGRDPGPLAGVPFGIKELFDVKGEITRAGSRILANDPPASHDAALVERLIQAGAIPIALTNMDEFAYGFATDNAHYGITRNPHDPARLAGGSSGGSAAGIAAHFFSLSIGSDTNGSIRVPASLCGVWGLRATQGTLPTQGSVPFVHSLDTVGPFADSAIGLRLCFEALAQTTLSLPSPTKLRVARAGGWFARNVSPPMEKALSELAHTLHADQTVTLPHIDRARAAAFIISASEGAGLHIKTLRSRPHDYDPAVRDRLLAGALLPSTVIYQAHCLRRWFREQMHHVFKTTDVIIAPAVVGPAPRLDQPLIMVDGQTVSARANLGLYTQPLTLAGFPVLSLPMKTDGLPLGAQLIAPPGREDRLFSLAEMLEENGHTQPIFRHH
ncbi:AtzE family amidohydrolase [Saccharibacter sp. 17.LH.SD]|uniref:AtzE family amidohydrolase n=1 Tax=Saccharibacter sp. 17.LH.SD TaxID=2689393 RepID=UPI001370A578|nr:AtzE family amidohydrolase [Saccharibacter sp. 17.LH.SD]MXV43703.1 AtzE family amidohydrolase [Saccharibacter sp. 17.LH.SD]